MIKHDELANSLWQARVNKTPIAPLTESNPDITIPDAYKISSTNFHRKENESKVKLVGKKIGLTSKAVQSQLGVNEPDFGYLTSDMQIKNKGKIDTKEFLQLRAEGEVAFVLKKDLNSENITNDMVVDATDYVVAAIEIIDSRIKDWKIKIQDTIADNASSALFVLGEKKQTLDQIDLRLAGMTLRKNQEVVSTGVGAACLDHPVNAVCWLANKMRQLGEPLKAGDIVLSGAYGPIVPMEAGVECEVEISGLGKVSCNFI